VYIIIIFDNLILYYIRTDKSKTLMLEINVQHRLPGEKEALFRHFENVRSLAARKPELR